MTRKMICIIMSALFLISFENISTVSAVSDWGEEDTYSEEVVLQEAKIERLKSEHSAAGQVYEYLRERGYSDAVIAGILGNMMVECGGHTLDLQWWRYGGGGAYYGLCQWSLYYGPGVRGLDINGQLDYLMNNMEKNMRVFGGNYEYFTSLQDAGTAAWYFCRYYERGAGGGIRMNRAYLAYHWITGSV